MSRLRALAVRSASRLPARGVVRAPVAGERLVPSSSTTTTTTTITAA